MRIIRANPEPEPAAIPKHAARDHRLSWKARGLLAELLSYDDGAGITVDSLVESAEESGDACEGKFAMRGAMKELVRLGYVVKTKFTDATGKWGTETTVFADPTGCGNRSGIEAHRPRELGHIKRLADTPDTADLGSTEERFSAPRREQPGLNRGEVIRPSANRSSLVTADAQPKDQSQKRAPTSEGQDRLVGTKPDRYVGEADEDWPEVAPIPVPDLSWTDDLYDRE